MIAVEIVAALAGASLVAVCLASAIRVLVLPRVDQSSFSRSVDSAVSWLVDKVAKRIKTYASLDRFLADTAVLKLAILALAWLGAMWIGYAAILWPFVDRELGTAFRESGSSMLTLGFASTSGTLPTAIDLLAGLSGFGLITMFIAYLPSLYAAFSRRETLVTMLDSRGGTPPWGPEILARHQLVTVSDDLVGFYSSWEQWAAEVAESHSTYPILIGFRSPHPDRSWLLGLLAVMDAAALHLALKPKSAPTTARLCVRMGFVALRAVADSIGLVYDPDPKPGDPIQLSRAEFDSAVRHLESSGFELEATADEAWPHFHGWRVNYEALAYALADRISAPAAPWSGTRRLFAMDPTLPDRPAHRTPVQRMIRRRRNDQ